MIYVFQLLNVTFEYENFNIISALLSAIWSRTGGILQADAERFSNEEGDHILWQFADTVSGDWNYTVLNVDGIWERFNMELNDLEQRRPFWEGKLHAAPATLM